MKRIILFLSFLMFMPASVFAVRDGCIDGKYDNSPDNPYTIDKRCYVTEAQKQTKPFNAVASLKDIMGGIYCSGVIVEKKGELYLYTAKHCVENDFGGTASIVLTSVNGSKRFFVKKEMVGTDDRDWAIYHINKEKHPDLKSVYISKKFKNMGNYDAVIAGYSSLKIVSDEQVEEFRKRYLEYQNDFVKGRKRPELGYIPTHGILVSNAIAKSFIDDLKVNNKEYYDTIFGQSGMQLSSCKYSSVGKMTGCQIWNGNSGSGIFDEDGNVMGIVTKGMNFIMGPAHARGVKSEALYPNPDSIFISHPELKDVKQEERPEDVGKKLLDEFFGK